MHVFLYRSLPLASRKRLYIKHLYFSILFIWKTVTHTAVFWISSLLIQLLHLHFWLLTSSCLLYRQPGGKPFEIHRSNSFVCSGKTALTRHLILGIVWKTFLSISRQTQFNCTWITQSQKAGGGEGVQVKMVFFSFLNQVSQTHLHYSVFRLLLGTQEIQTPAPKFSIFLYPTLYELMYTSFTSFNAEIWELAVMLVLLLHPDIDWLMDWLMLYCHILGSYIYSLDLSLPGPQTFPLSQQLTLRYTCG